VVHELPPPFCLQPSLLSFFLSFIILLGALGDVVYDISSDYPLKVGQFITLQGLGHAWVP